MEPTTPSGWNPGFAVLYRWRVHAGRERDFIDAWERITLALREHRGALGSRLHRDPEGTFVAYAQWPDRGTWATALAQPSLDAEASRTMGECIAGSEPPLELTPLVDRLLPTD